MNIEREIMDFYCQHGKIRSGHVVFPKNISERNKERERKRKWRELVTYGCGNERLNIIK